MKRPFRLALSALALMAAVPASAQIVAEPIEPIATTAGLVAGKVLGSGVHAWFGVPFAAPPLRELRWTPPQAHEPWEGVWNADRFAPECMQTLRDSDINHYFGEEALSEDCLYLNIWAPPGSSAGDDLPVVVWIYGGGLRVGSASMDNYHGEGLAQEGVVYVSIAYRLGAMGFMAHPELTAESEYGGSGNYGLMDQTLALKWVADNIGNFGGDAENVTIVGQSGGSRSTSTLQISPQAQGLFDKILAMSGATINSSVVPQEEMEQAGLELQEAMGAETLADMRAASSDRFVFEHGDHRFGYTVDGHAIPTAPIEAFRSGNFADVPLIAGYTWNESGDSLSRNIGSAEDFMAAAEANYPGHAETLAQVYGIDGDLAEATGAAGRDQGMGTGMRDWVLAQREFGEAPTWMYVFRRTQPYTPGVTFADHDPATVGAYHTVEVPYFLRTLDSLNMFRTTRDWGPEDETLRDFASGALLALARSGDPSTEMLDWPEFTEENQQVVIFDAGEIETVEIPNREALDIFRSMRTQ